MLKAKKLLVALLSCCAALPLYARTVIDNNGDEVEIPEEVKSVVTTTIYPFASAVITFTRDPAKLIGMHELSLTASKNGLLGKLYPEVLKADTSFAKGDSVNVEALLALNPDIVFVNAQDKRQIEALRSAGIATYAISVSKWGFDVAKTHEAWLASLNDVFPSERETSKIIGDFRASIDSLVKSRLATAKPKRIFFMVTGKGPQIVTSGSNFFGEYWAKSVNSINVAHSLTAQKSQSVVTMEEVYAWNPDVILITNFTPTTREDILNSTGTESDRDWSSVKAVQDKAVFKMPLGLYRSFTPSMDSPLTQLWLAITLYPEYFSDIDFFEYATDYYKHLTDRKIPLEALKAAYPFVGQPENKAASTIK